MTWLLIHILIVSLYDMCTRHISNWATYPLILAGIVINFPGHMNLWLACFLLFSAWASSWMGAGDVKFWMAVLWVLPNSNIPFLIPLVFLSSLITGVIQFIWRVIQKQPLTGAKSPAAWRIIPFLLMVWYVH